MTVKHELKSWKQNEMSTTELPYMGKQLLIKIYSIYHSEVGGIRPTYQSTHPHSLINGLLFIIEIHAAKILEHYFSSNWGWVLRIFTLRIYFKLSIELPKNPLFLLSYIITSLGFLPLTSLEYHSCDQSVSLNILWKYKGLGLWTGRKQRRPTTNATIIVIPLWVEIYYCCCLIIMYIGLLSTHFLSQRSWESSVWAKGSLALSTADL